jgi:WD40 repeat protein
MKRRWWKFAPLLVPLALYAYITERNSWRPKTLNVGKDYSAFQVAFSHDSKTIGVACDNTSPKQRPDKLMCWNVAARQLMWSFSTNNGQLGSIAFLPDSHDIASLYWGADGTITNPARNVLRFHDGANGKLQRKLRVADYHDKFGWASYLCIWPDKTTFFHKQANNLHLTDIKNGRTRPLYLPFQGVRPHFSTLALAPNGKTLATAAQPPWQPPVDASEFLMLFDLSSRKVRRWLKSSNADGLNTLAFSPNSELLASDTPDLRSAIFTEYRVKLWDVRNAKLRYVLKGLQDETVAFAFSPDSQILAAADVAGHICLWDTVSGQLLRTLKHGKARLFTVAFSPDGRTLASGGADGTVKLWRIK